MKTTRKQWQNQFCKITRLKNSFKLESKTKKYQPIKTKTLTELFQKYCSFDIQTQENLLNYFY